MDATLAGKVEAGFRRRRLTSFAVPAALLVYFAYIFVAFDVAGLAQRIRFDNAAILASDFWSYKTHVERDNRSGEVSVAVEGETRGRYPEGDRPEWVAVDGDATVIDLGGGHVVTYRPDGADFVIPGYGTVNVVQDGRDFTVELPPGPTPDWISLSGTRVNVTTDAGRFSYTRNEAVTFRYQPGWELWFFTLDSPFSRKSPGELLALALWEPRIDPERSNLGYMLSEWWTNDMWHHNKVYWAIFETILMAFIGTFLAALVSLPLAFLAASNFTPFRWLRFAVKRVFDFVRGVDALIFTILLARAFGPGPMTGALAILITDVGSLGKLFAEALENIDEKQVEGVRSTGANGLQRARFGVIPQVMPVFLSQVLYHFESNTRSATIIGAIVGGGIGLLLTQAISTQKDWEEVSYYIVLIIIMVIAMDWLSGILRRRLIKGTDGGH
ncbi:MAG: phosphonate ABC transporter, permease protein PhnE [Rhodobacteraceae bacterium]|jgi:phosphonate transport system permease protein|nr:phosphonate ABC transporter, permease protein PhnE [Paracoccaceae bacterium]